MNDDHSERQAAIGHAFDWQPINAAIDKMAHGAGIEPDAAWDAIKEAIGLAALPAQCIDEQGERIALETHWIGFLIPFQLPGEPGIGDQPIGALPAFLRCTDFPEAGILWFDRRRAAENRLARNVTADNRPERSLPPTRVRDVVVNCDAVERLCAALATEQEQQRLGYHAPGPVAARMSARVDLVPLGRVYGHKDGPIPSGRPKVEALIDAITNEFEGGALPVYGRRAAGRARKRIWPTDHEIDWTGKQTDTDDYCSVCAFRRGLANWTYARSREVVDDVFEDLAMARSDWERIERLVGSGFSTRSATPHRFEKPPWELGDVFGWVLDRDRAKFGRVFSLADWRSALHHEAMSKNHMSQPSARMVLLHSLQRGDLIGRDRTGNSIAADWWLPKTEADLPALGREVLFRGKEVLRLWPELKPETGPAASSAAVPKSDLPAPAALSTRAGSANLDERHRPGPRPKVGPRVQAAMHADIKEGKMTAADLRGMKQVEMKARYSASESMCREARAAVLSELGEISQIKNSDE